METVDNEMEWLGEREGGREGSGSDGMCQSAADGLQLDCSWTATGQLS